MIETFVFLRLLSMNSPEWPSILIGCLACACIGGCQILFAILLAKIINVRNSII